MKTLRLNGGKTGLSPFLAFYRAKIIKKYVKEEKM